MSTMCLAVNLDARAENGEIALLDALAVSAGLRSAREAWTAWGPRARALLLRVWKHEHIV